VRQEELKRHGQSSTRLLGRVAHTEIRLLGARGLECLAHEPRVRAICAQQSGFVGQPCPSAVRVLKTACTVQVPLQPYKTIGMT
jgi:hypothetical protein